MRDSSRNHKRSGSCILEPRDARTICAGGHTGALSGARPRLRTQAVGGDGADQGAGEDPGRVDDRQAVQFALGHRERKLGAADPALPPLPSNPVTATAIPVRNLGRTGYQVGRFSLGGQAAVEKPENETLASAA